ncbi:22014_t:CDS:2 [Cetraspora pellucida]|uniref:22014_t:CDS:1 n=1 Tax=Cetraspora pellucida TaxID=1433469 RepID=A0A9N9J1R6_9GLOM|nr:22014_t:CDS:2 [Cetraspora pellucida]
MINDTLILLFDLLNTCLHQDAIDPTIYGIIKKEEWRFKDAEIIQECYMKLNKPVNADDNLQYTYLNMIIDHIFTNSNTEKNSIAFGIAIALKYFDPLKRINMVPTEVIDRMNYILERIQVMKLEKL